MKDMGKVMGALKSKHADTLDFSKVSGIIKKLNYTVCRKRI